MNRVWLLVTALLVAGLTFLALGALPASWPRPDPFLLVVSTAALRGGSGWGSAAGLAAGVLQAALAPGPAGGYLLIYLGLGWLLGRVPRPSPVLVLLLTAAATVGVAAGWAGLARWLNSEPSPTRLLQWLPGALGCNLALCLPVFNWWKRRDHRRRLR